MKERGRSSGATAPDEGSPTELCLEGAARADEAEPPLEPEREVSPATPVTVAYRSRPEDPLLGLRIGSFRLVRRLGKGGMGSVYLGEHTVIGSKVAVKLLHSHLATNESLVERFYAEARAVNLIGHENIVSIFDMSVVPPQRYYLIMEYLEGASLCTLARTPTAPEVAVPILLQICDALHAAHAQGVIHRDLKPENVFLVRRDRTPHFVKVLDFGIAKLHASGFVQRQTSEGALIGTPEFMAPEQWSGQPVDGRTDLYSLGIIAYQMLTGRLPFQGQGMHELLCAHMQRVPPAPHALRPEVPEALSDVVMRALAKQPGERFRDAAELRAALQQALSDRACEPILPPPPVSTPPPSLAPPTPSLMIRVVTAAGAELPRLPCTDLSRGGLFLCMDGALPPLLSRVELTLQLPERELTCAAEVVRHVTPAQARAWGMSPGFGVQFLAPSPEVREAVTCLLQRLPLPPLAASSSRSVADDARAEALLGPLRRQLGQELYALLSLPPDAPFEAIRLQARSIRGTLEEIAARPLSARQASELAAVRARVEKAAETLGHLHRRAEYDAWRGNFSGVARCISSGLTVTALEALRARFLLAHPGAEASGRIYATTAGVWESQGKDDQALQEYERALTADPLNLRFQQRYWALRRRSA